MKAKLRKEALLNGTYGSFSVEKGVIHIEITTDCSRSKIGGWLPEWDSFKKPIIRRPYKLKKRERTREARSLLIHSDVFLESIVCNRFKSIEEKLAEQPQKLKDHRKVGWCSATGPALTLFLRPLRKQSPSQESRLFTKGWLQ